MPISPDIIVTDGSQDITNVETYSVTEYATPLAWSEMGGIGTISATIDNTEDPEWLITKRVHFVDPENGEADGYVRVVTDTESNPTPISANISIDLLLALSNVKRVAEPFVGTLGDYIDYVLSLVGVTSGVVVEPSIASRLVTYPGWSGEVWNYLKLLCQAQQMEITQIGGEILFNLPDQFEVELDRPEQAQRSTESRPASQYLECVVYQTEELVSGVAYPYWVRSENDERSLNIEANTTETFTFQLDAYLTSVDQPTPVSWVPPQGSGASEYAVSGSDGLPIDPQLWIDRGGSVTVSIGEVSNELIIEVRGADLTEYSPFQLAMSSGVSNRYPALYVTGDGVVSDNVTIRGLTGAAPATTQDEVGAVIDNPFR